MPLPPAQSTFCDPMGCTVPGILQVRILEWVAVPLTGDYLQQGDLAGWSTSGGSYICSEKRDIWDGPRDCPTEWSQTEKELHRWCSLYVESKTGSGLSSLCYTATSHELVILHMVMYTFQWYSLNSSHSLVPFPHCVQSRFSTFASVFLPCKQVHQYHFSRFHMYALIYICFSLWLHSV